MNGLAEWAACFWRASWQSAVLAAMVVAISFLVRRRVSASWRCGMWVLVAIRMMLPVLPGSRFSLFNLFNRDEGGTIVGQAIQPTAKTQVIVRYGAMSFDKIPLPSPNTTGWAEILAMAWAAGFIVFLSRQGVKEWRSVVMVRGMARISEKSVLELVEQCRVEIGLRRRVRVVGSDRFRTPAIAGFWRAALILPAHISISDAELRLVILHELAHVCRFDLQMDRVLSIVRDMHWFNPIGWLMLHCWRAEREIACDEKVLRLVGAESRQEYGEIVLKLVERFSNLAPAAGAVGLFETHSNLRRRIGMIGTFNNSRYQWVLGVIIMIAFAGTALTDTRSETASTLPTTHEIAPMPKDDIVVCVYDLSDIIARDALIWDSHALPTDDIENLSTSKPDPKKVQAHHAEIINSIINVIHQGVPNSWRDNGGEGTITQIQGQDQILIAQTADAHEKISKLLTEMRHYDEREVNINASFLILNDAVIRQMGFAIGTNAMRSKNESRISAVYLDEEKVKELLKMAQHDRNCKVIANPRVTVFNNQEANVAIETQTAYVADISKTNLGNKDEYKPRTDVVKTGEMLEVAPYIAPGEKGVTVLLHARQKRLVEMKSLAWKDNPQWFIQKPIVDIHDDGQSAVFIPNSTALLVNLKDTVAETPGQSYWLLLRPQILEMKREESHVLDMQTHAVK